MLGFSRLSTAAYGVIARVVDEDGIFRARIAEEADEADVGRVGWLWLQRPVGWRDDPALTGGGGDLGPADRPASRARRDDKAAADRLRKAAAEADAARRRATDQLAEARKGEAALRRERDALAAATEALRDERNAAVRRSKEVEAQLATARRDLKIARQATMAAEEELARVRATGAPGSPAPAAELAAAEGAKGAKGEKKRGKLAGKGRARVHPALPPGVFDATPAAHRALLGDPANLVVVDGYNVARAAWSALAPEEERRRVVALLEEVQARSGGRVVVVFDGDDAVSAPKASKSVLVRFSATGQTADDAIVNLLAATPDRTPVVVVSSDRAVAADARRQGAVAIGARAFLAAAGR